MKKRHPLQPIVWDGEGTVRFQENPIIRFLQEFAASKGMGLNELHMLRNSNWSKRDWSQFMQLLGYSVSGFGDLSFIPETDVHKADIRAENLRQKCPQDPNLL